MCYLACKYRTARDRLAQSTWLLACSFHGNLGLTTTAAVPDRHRLRHEKLPMKIDQVTVMVVHLAATGQLMFKRQR
jgi:hypothetical protein